MTSSFESIALWNRDRRVIAVLGVFCLAHWAILWRGMFIVDAQYSDEAQSCVVVSLNHVFLNAGFFTSKPYTVHIFVDFSLTKSFLIAMGFDLIILCFTIAALFRQQAHSDLWKLLFRDGLVYFCITFLCNAVPAVRSILIYLQPFMLMDFLYQILNVISLNSASYSFDCYPTESNLFAL